LHNRIEEIKAKGFDIVSPQIDTTPQPTGYNGLPVVDFNKIKIGAKTLDDAVFKLGDLKKANPRLADKKFVLDAIRSYDLQAMREISNFFYLVSGIYARLLRYMAFMYRYDWMITPYVNDESVKKEKILTNFTKGLKILDDFSVKKTFGEIALSILRDGAYYGYKVPINKGDTSIVLQQLPVNYCRTRFFKGKKPAVEFNMKFFDEQFRDTNQKMKMLKMFPDEFSKGYVLYKQGKLPPETMGDTRGWYLLDPENTVRFTVNGEEYPAFISAIPLIIDLDEARDLDKKRTLQRLLKIVVQQMPLDKNGELIFDVEEAQQLHNNAVQMLSRAIGVDVLTTFADVSVESMVENQATAQTDDLARVERQVYNESGVSQNQFNTDGNIALEKSILNDEATMYNMLLQFEEFLNELLKPINGSPKKMEFRVQLLTTTIYNYKDLSKLYKEQMQIGFSKMLPQIALGQSQSSILANAYFENDILDLVNVFIPPLMSSTMNENILNRVKGAGTPSNGGSDKTQGEGAGRKELADDQKSEKTIANKESMS
jgi:hypothetical protein